MDGVRGTSQARTGYSITHRDGGVPDGGTGADDASVIEMDGAVAVDSGTGADAGETMEDGGCSCRVQGRSSGGSRGLWPLGLALAFVLARRRRRG